MRRFKAFTILEVLTIVVIIAILGALSYPVFRRAIEKGRERIAITNLKLILAGENLYRLSYDHYFPPPGGRVGLDDINKYLNLDIERKYYTYEIESEGRYRFKAYAVKDGKRIYSIDQDGNITHLQE